MSEHSEAFVGFDTSKLLMRSHRGRWRGGEVRFFGEIENAGRRRRSWWQTCRQYERLTFCYEAGRRLWLYRRLRARHGCNVVAIAGPKKPGDRVKPTGATP